MSTIGTKKFINTPSHGRFDGMDKDELLAAHPSPENAASDTALDHMQAARLAGSVVRDAILDKTPASQAAKLDRARWLRAWSNACQGNVRPPAIDAQRVLFERGATLANGEQNRAIQLGALQVCQHDQSWRNQVFKPSTTIDAALADVVETPDVQKCIVDLLAWLVEYEAVYLENWDLLNPESRRAEIRRLIHDPSIGREARTALVDESVRLKDEHARDLCAATKTAVAEFWNTNVKPAGTALINAVLTELQNRKALAVAHEHTFFLEHGAQHQETAISAKYNRAIKHLEAALSPRPTPAPIQGSGAVYLTEHSALSLLGIRFDPIALAAVEAVATEPAPAAT